MYRNKATAGICSVFALFCLSLTGCGEPTTDPSRKETDVSHDSLIGYWISQSPNDFTGEYLFKTFTRDRFLDLWEMIPYEIVRIKDQQIQYRWMQEAYPLGPFERNTLVHVLSEGVIRIQYDNFSEGYIYERVSRDVWEKRYAEDNQIQLDQLRSQLQKLLNRNQPRME